MFTTHRVQLNSVDWMVAMVGLISAIYCPFGETLLSFSVPAAFKWAGVMLLLSSFTHQVLQERMLHARCFAVWLGSCLIGVYFVLMFMSITELLFMFPCQCLIFCALVWLAGAWLRIPLPIGALSRNIQMAIAQEEKGP